MARKTRLVTWNGTDLPPEFRDLPAGRYVVEAVEVEAPALSPEEGAGIEAALESYQQGRVVDAKRAREIIDAALEPMPGRRWLARAGPVPQPRRSRVPPRSQSNENVGEVPAWHSSMPCGANPRVAPGLDWVARPGLRAE